MRDHVHYLMEAVKEAAAARENGNTPFGAVLVDADGTIVLRRQNIEITERDCTGHAETALARAAAKRYDKEFLWHCTLYSIAEPCAMCTGAIYWANVGRIVYGITEKQLLSLTGADEQNPTFDLPCRDILARGQKPIEVIGPVDAVAEAVLEVHAGYWSNQAEAPAE